MCPRCNKWQANYVLGDFGSGIADLYDVVDTIGSMVSDCDILLGNARSHAHRPSTMLMIVKPTSSWTLQGPDVVYLMQRKHLPIALSENMKS
jgi:hypothetical protein